MANFQNDVISSVIGFNLDATITYRNLDGEFIPVCKGCKTVTYKGEERPKIGISKMKSNFFTNFNQALLDKIKDYQSKQL